MGRAAEYVHTGDLVKYLMDAIGKAQQAPTVRKLYITRTHDNGKTQRTRKCQNRLPSRSPRWR